MSYEPKIKPKDEKPKAAGGNPDLLGDRAPYNHMSEYGRYEEGSPVAVEVEKNMRAIRNRITTPKQMEPHKDAGEEKDPEDFMEAAKRRITLNITIEV